ncbi:type IV toxin-antitoxin system AbiEi family antitoxin domain-containing protein [Tenacibaculum agarivorans]|uniref:type IV toxin-antitoxin system AbiEi family antitoxin domain-containing protein n=1 Tax=Tenacibaculum agarivorans TaxID=1908389 RepID=UPI00094BA2AD|nr:hypothetical protein [Tenacibaculum agarivorans]
MKIESFSRAKNHIIAFFEASPMYAFTLNDLREIFVTNRELWRIAAYRNIKSFIDFIEDNKILILQVLQDSEGSEKKIWSKENANNFDTGLTIKKEGYLSNYSAMQVHQLTLQIPKTIYVSYDMYKMPSYAKPKTLEQEAVDRAFKKKQRTSNDIYISKANNFKYSFLQKKHESVHVGIIKIDRYAVTDLERTLIDIAVRPAYSGGVFEVLEAFRNAKDKIDPKKLDRYLDKLDYIYPFHQLIGFYMDRAGYSKAAIVPFQNKVSTILFYLTYDLSTTKLDTTWNMYYPLGF